MQGFFFRLLPPRPTFSQDMSPDERATMLAHVAYWTGLAEQGRALAFGPVGDPAGAYGVGVVLAEDLQAAQRLRDEDPAVLSAHGFRTELQPMLQLVTPTGSYPPR